VRAQIVPARDRLPALRGRAQCGQRAAVRGGRRGQLADRVALADVCGRVRGLDAAQRLGELLRAGDGLRADDARRAPVDLAAQRVLDGDPRAEAVERVGGGGARADAHHQRPWRHVVVSLQRGGSVRRGTRVLAEQRADQLLLAQPAVELGVGLGLQDRRRSRRRLAGAQDVLVGDGWVLDQP
jgi:hypothetical protein